MKTRSAKAKGRRLQDIVSDKLLEAFPQLTEDDCKGAVMGISGRDIKLSTAAQRLIPYSIECKNTEKLAIWSALKQSEDNAGNLIPAVVFKRNRSKTYVALELDEFIKLIKK